MSRRPLPPKTKPSLPTMTQQAAREDEGDPTVGGLASDLDMLDAPEQDGPDTNPHSDLPLSPEAEAEAIEDVLGSPAKDSAVQLSLRNAIILIASKVRTQYRPVVMKYVACLNPSTVEQAHRGVMATSFPLPYQPAASNTYLCRRADYLSVLGHHIAAAIMAYCRVYHDLPTKGDQEAIDFVSILADDPYSFRHVTGNSLEGHRLSRVAT